MGYNLKNTRDGKSISKIPKWPSLGPWDRYMENVAGEKGLALQQLFPYKSSYFFKISNCHKISFLNDGDPKLGYLDIFDMLFPFLKFAKLWPKIL